LFIFLTLLVRLGWIQLYQGEELAAEALAQRTRQIEIAEYPRGEILDRNRLPLTDATFTVALYAIPEEISANPAELLSGSKRGQKSQVMDAIVWKLAACLNHGNPVSIKRELLLGLASGRPAVRIAADLTAGEIQRIKRSGLPGLVVAPEMKRYQEYGCAVHLIGYVGGGDPPRGMSGIERCYEGLLSKPEANLSLAFTQDARGTAIKGLKLRSPDDSEVLRGSVVLTIDKRIQQAVEEVMNSRVGKGAVVVMDVRSKEILAIASRPVYDPYSIAAIIRNDRNGSLNNRSLMSYPPGSLFKLLIAAAALEEGLVTRDETFVCTGEYRFNQEAVIPCWKQGGHGKISFAEALAQSCNSVFIETGLRLGRERLIRYARQLDLTDESIGGFSYGPAGSGIVIDGGEAALGNASIGQQGVMLTPVQLCSLTATIADDGIWGRPCIVDCTIDKQGKIRDFSSSERRQTMKPETAKVLQSMMVKAVEQGTARNAAPYEAAVAGKTGTGQTGNIGRDNEEILNTWFAGYFPVERPQWAVVVLVEEGKSGAEDAAPVFRDIAARVLKTLPSCDE